MNILYLSERDPRDYDFGGAQRTHYIWKALQQIGEVYCIYYSLYDEDQEIAHRIWCLKKYFNLDKKQFWKYRICRKLLKNLNILPLWPVSLRSIKTPEEIFNVKFDIVVARYCFDLCEMHLWNYPKVYIDFDDHPLEMFDTVKKKDVPPYLQPLSRLIIKLQLKHLEGKITKGWISNPKQVHLFYNHKLIVPLKNVALVPSSQYNPHSHRKEKLITVGVMGYYPNYIGVEKFLNEIWPIINRAYPQIEYHIIGRYVPKQYQTKWSNTKGVIVRGFVDDLEKEYEECLASVVPVDNGGGTCIKTLESMSHSRVCLATPFGARGLEEYIKKDDIGIYIYNNSTLFMELLQKKVLCSDERLIHESNAQKFIADNHSISSFTNTIIDTIVK